MKRFPQLPDPEYIPRHVTPKRIQYVDAAILPRSKQIQRVQMTDSAFKPGYTKRGCAIPQVIPGHKATTGIYMESCSPCLPKILTETKPLNAPAPSVSMQVPSVQVPIYIPSTPVSTYIPSIKPTLFRAFVPNPVRLPYPVRLPNPVPIPAEPEPPQVEPEPPQVEPGSKAWKVAQFVKNHFK